MAEGEEEIGQPLALAEDPAEAIAMAIGPGKLAPGMAAEVVVVVEQENPGVRARRFPERLRRHEALVPALAITRSIVPIDLL
jgi:predicted amidohydrolase